jgi:hypothetical protein
MYEIIVQRDYGPSAFRDTVQERGYGLHHYAYVTRDFDTEVGRLKAQGHDVVFEVWTGADLDFKRVSYFDTRHTVGAMTEVSEYCEPIINTFRAVRQKCIDWDGLRILRPLSELFSKR